MSYSVFMVTQTFKTHPMTYKLNLPFSFRAQRRKTDRSASALESSSSPYFYSSDTSYVPFCTLRRDMSLCCLSLPPGRIQLNLDKNVKNKIKVKVKYKVKMMIKVIKMMIKVVKMMIKVVKA